MLENEYDFYLADTDAGKSIHYGLRYQVYCLRERYEDPSRHPEFLERDEFDDISVHFIARSRLTGEWLGAMRVVVGSLDKLPVSRLSSLDSAELSHPDWKTVAEASRLCTLLPKSLRTNFIATSSYSPSKCTTRLSAARTLQTSWIAMGLIRAGRQFCLMQGVTYGFFLISDPLARLLRRLGMDIQPVGSPCQHRGWRSPYIHNVKTGYQAMAVRSPDLYRSFCQTDAYARYSELVVDHHEPRLAAIG